MKRNALTELGLAGGLASLGGELHPGVFLSLARFLLSLSLSLCAGNSQRPTAVARTTQFIGSAAIPGGLLARIPNVQF